MRARTIPHGGTVKGANGVIYQAGLRVGSRHESRLHGPVGTYRAIVMATYAVDSERNLDDSQIRCDVILLRSQIPLADVPIASRIGVNDAAPWIPKPTTATFSGQPLRLRVYDARGGFEGAGTQFGDMNGDVVLVQFIDDDPEFPVIVAPFTHDRTKRKVKNGAGWSEASPDTQRGTPEREEEYLRFGGAELRVNKDGDVLVDTVGATSDLVAEVPSLDTGKVLFRMKHGLPFRVAGGGPGPLRSDLFSLVQELTGAIVAEIVDGEWKLERDVAGNLKLSIGNVLELQRVGAVVTFSIFGVFSGNLGSGGIPSIGLGFATEPVLKGTTYTNLVIAVFNALNAWVTVASPLIPGGGPTLAALASALSFAITSYSSGLSSALSTQVTTG